MAEGVFEVGLNAAGTVPQARVARASSTHTGHAELQCAVAGFHIDCNMLLHLDERCKRRLAGSLLGGMRLHLTLDCSKHETCCLYGAERDVLN